MCGHQQGQGGVELLSVSQGCTHLGCLQLVPEQAGAVHRHGLTPTWGSSAVRCGGAKNYPNLSGKP